MEKEDIVQGQIGSVGQYDLDFKGGKLIGTAEASKPELGITVKTVVELDARAVLAAVKRKIPGQVDDALIGLLETALLS